MRKRVSVGSVSSLALVTARMAADSRFVAYLHRNAVLDVVDDEWRRETLADDSTRAQASPSRALPLVAALSDALWFCCRALPRGRAGIDIPPEIDMPVGEAEDARAIGQPQTKQEDKWLELGLDDLQEA